jgi:hypothetical protein
MMACCAVPLAAGGCAYRDSPAPVRSAIAPLKTLGKRLLAAVPSLRSDSAAKVASRPVPKPGAKAGPGDVRARLIHVAEREWRFFGGAQWRYRLPSIGHARLEYEPGARERVQYYWSHALHRKVRDTRRVGWSGAFISFVMKDAGAKARFPYSGTHTTYIARAIENRKKGRLKAPIVGYRPGEYAPRPGDMVCNSLTSGIDYDHINRPYAAHCDVVVGRGFRQIFVIGGNLTNSVRKRTLLTDESGHVYPHQPRRIDPYVKRWFVIIKVNM